MLDGGDGLVDGGDVLLVVLIRRWVDGGVVDGVKVIASTGYTVVIVIDIFPVVLLIITIGIATTTIISSKRSRSIA